MAPTFSEAFKMNPFWISLAIVAIALGLLSAVVGLVLAAKASRAAIVFGIVAVLAGVAAAGVGGIGWWQNHVMTRAAVSSPGLSRADRSRMEAVGEASGGYSVEVGACGLLPLLGGVAALGLGLVRKK